MGDISSGVSWSLRFLVRVRGGGAAGVEGGVSSGGTVGGGCFGFWGAGGWRRVLCFPFRVITAGVPRFLHVFAGVCVGGATIVGGGISPGDSGGEGWSIFCFPFRVTTGAMVVAGFGSSVVSSV